MAGIDDPVIKAQQLSEIEEARKIQLQDILELEAELLKIQGEQELLKEGTEEYNKKQQEALQITIKLKSLELATTKKINQELIAAGGLSEEDIKKLIEKEEKLKEILKTTQRQSKELKAQADTQISIRNTLKDIVQINKVSFQTILQGAIAFDALQASINKATNTQGFYNDILRDTVMTQGRYGVTGEKVVQTIGELSDGFANFSNLTEDARGELTNFTAKMDTAGISVSTTAKFLNVASRAMGMGTQQVIGYEKQLFAFSKANGITMKAINDGLANVMPRMAVFGKEAPKIFEQSAFQAKQLGLEMGKLLDITEQFTTFEGAAESAGQLNAVLGGNMLDSMELMKASLEDQPKAIEMLREALQRTGKTYDQLSAAERRVFQDVLKQDATTTAALFSKTSQEIKNAEISETAFNDAVASFVPLGEKLKALVATMTPIFQAFSAVLGFVADGIAIIASIPFLNWLIGVFLAATVLGKTIWPLGVSLWNFAKSLIAAGKASITSTTEMAAATTKTAATSRGFFASLASGIRTIGRAATQSAVGLVVLGITIAAIGAGVYLAAIGMAELVKSFAGLGETAWSAVAALAVLGVSFALFLFLIPKLAVAAFLAGGAIGLLALPILAIGAAMLMAGHGAAQLTTFISQLASDNAITNLKTFASLFAQIAESASIIGDNLNLTAELLVKPVPVTIVPASIETVQTKTAGAGTTTPIEKELVIRIDSPIYLEPGAKTVIGNLIEERYMQLKQDPNNPRSFVLADTNITGE